MNDPYRILGLVKIKNNSILTDEDVKVSYLKNVRRYPPDRNPEKFKRIRRAFEKIETEKKRLYYEILDTSLPNKEELICVLLSDKKKKLQSPNLRNIQRLLADS